MFFGIVKLILRNHIQAATFHKKIFTLPIALRLHCIKSELVGKRFRKCGTSGNNTKLIFFLQFIKPFFYVFVFSTSQITIRSSLFISFKASFRLTQAHFKDVCCAIISGMYDIFTGSNGSCPNTLFQEAVPVCSEFRLPYSGLSSDTPAENKLCRVCFRPKLPEAHFRYSRGAQSPSF